MQCITVAEKCDALLFAVQCSTIARKRNCIVALYSAVLVPAQCSATRVAGIALTCSDMYGGHRAAFGSGTHSTSTQSPYGSPLPLLTRLMKPATPQQQHLAALLLLQRLRALPRGAPTCVRHYITAVTKLWASCTELLDFSDAQRPLGLSLPDILPIQAYIHPK